MKAKSRVKVKGMFRLQIEENGKIVGDSGWKRNQVTNLGFNQYLVQSLGSVTLGAGKSVTHMAIGTGTVPGASATSLDGEQSVREAVTAATSSDSKTVRFTATFASSDNFVTATKTIQNIGLFNTSTAASGTLFAGKTYATSACATNQNVNATYDIIFA